MANETYEDKGTGQQQDSTNNPGARTKPAANTSSTGGRRSSYSSGAPTSSSLGNPRESNSQSVGGGLDNAGLSQAENNAGKNLYNPNGDQTGGSLGDREARGGASGDSDDSDDKLGNGYTPPGNSNNTRRGVVKFIQQNPRKSFAAAVTGTLVGVVLTLLSISSGPLEIVHIAQLMEHFHLSHQQDAGSNRMGKLYRFLRSGNNVGETRLGYLGSRMNANMLADLESIGLKPEFGRLNTYSGFTIDRANPESPYHGMTDEQVKAKLASKGVTKGITVDRAGIHVTSNAYLQSRAQIKAMVGELGYSSLSTYVHARTLSKYGLVDWHPLKQLDRRTNLKIGALYDKWRQAREDRLKNGVKGTTIDPSSAKEQTKNTNGDTTNTDISSPPSTPDSNTIKDTLNSISSSKGFKVTGGIAAATGIVCAAKTVDDNIGDINKVRVIEPLIRMGSDVLTVASQIMSNRDVDIETVGFVAKSFTETDANGNVKSTWNQSKSIQAELGQPQNGQDMPQSTKDLLKGDKPSLLDWTQSSAVGDLCSTGGQIISGVISVGVGILSGGTVSTAFSFVASYLGGPTVIDFLSNLLTGNTIDVAAKGAAWGSDINFGARLFGNAVALPFGGTALSNTQVAELNTEQNAISNAQFKKESLATRIFDPWDQRTLVSHFIDGVSPSVTQNVATLTSNFANIGSSLLKMPATMLSGRAHADTPYDYGFPEIGYSLEDQNNPIVADPYANADKVATLLDSSEGQQYRDQAKKCWGINISKIDNLWGVTPGAASDQPNPYDNGKYSTSDCQHPSGLNQDDWLRVRFFVLDTGNMEGFACVRGDDQSCTNDGFDDSTSSASTTTPGTLPTGTAKDLATQLKPIIASGKIKCEDNGVFNDCPDIQNSASGTSIKGGSGCQVDALQPALLGMLLELVNMGHTFTLSALCSDHSSDGLKGHAGGRAADFNTIDGTFMGPNDVPWDSAKIAAGQKLDQDIASFMPKSTGFGQIQCHPTFGFLSGFDTFNDLCHHQHIQVEN